jgi:hypothetical protein
MKNKTSPSKPGVNVSVRGRKRGTVITPGIKLCRREDAERLYGEMTNWLRLR